MKKAVTTYPNMNNRKFNPGGFQKQLQSFYDWDKKKKAHLKRLEEEKLEREKKLLKNPQINTEANLKFNTNPKNYDAVERLYNQDRQKREEKKIALTKIYTPTFKPKLYSNKHNLGKTLQQNNNTKAEKKIKIKVKKNLKTVYKEEDEENENENNYLNDDNDNSKDNSKDNNKGNININLAKKNKTFNNFNEKEKKDRKGGNKKKEKEKENKTINKKNSKQRTNLSQKKKTITWKLTDDENGESSEEEEKKKERKVKFTDKNSIENRFRELLFKKMKPITRRNNSVGRRKKF